MSETKPPPAKFKPVHPRLVRYWHWINAFAILLMVGSGWRIYNASPIFKGFRFPNDWTIGAWLGGALQIHFAAMWLFVINGLVYLIYGVVSGHFRRAFLPLDPREFLRDFALALRGKLPHHIGSYNAVQRLFYIGVILAIVGVFVSGLAVWKPVQFQTLAALMGGYEGARIVHFLMMSAIVAFVLVHLTLVALVPKTLWPMLWGRARGEDEEGGQS
ncbi:MAG: cytochrome b/b6 domain-containing protein [Alphaproteobacteria bacterium]|nr:cytochrome b/b6 domain-containing protein [Alphaproteobacteria bacterium]